MDFALHSCLGFGTINRSLPLVARLGSNTDYTESMGITRGRLIGELQAFDVHLLRHSGSADEGLFLRLRQALLLRPFSSSATE